MNELQVQEPPTLGRVLLRTTKGELMVELWSRECPLACRNFVQRCMDGYYHGCIFHRIVPNFLVQTGDPSNTGTAVESIYTEPFADEFHSRLRYRYRGLLGVASDVKGNSGNGSQFFITLQNIDALNGQRTLFGRLVGDSVYRLADIASVEVDKNDRPVGEYPPRILETTVLENPFPDMRTSARKPAYDAPTRTVQQPAVKQKIQAKSSKTLSFLRKDESDIDDSTVAPPKISMARPVDIATKAPEPSPQAKTSEPPNEVLSEIERIKAAIKVSKPSAKPAPSNPVKRAAESADDSIVKRLKEWGKKIEAKKPNSGSDSIVTNGLISRSESHQSVSGSDWLNHTAGPIKFAIDSRSAYNR